MELLSEIDEINESLKDELEALIMTLLESEFSLEREGDRIILNFSIIPAEMDRDLELLVKSKDLALIKRLKVKQMPIIELRIEIPVCEPSSSIKNISFSESSFYNDLKSQILPTLLVQIEKDNPILFQWYNYCQNELLDAFFP